MEIECLFAMILRCDFWFPVLMSIMERRKIWQSHSLSQLMLGDAFHVGMNLLARYWNLTRM